MVHVAAPVKQRQYLIQDSCLPSVHVADTKPTSMSFRSELDCYLEDEMVDIHTKGFDILDWWKVVGTHYPTLRKIARDTYAIPITTVA